MGNRMSDRKRLPELGAMSQAVNLFRNDSIGIYVEAASIKAGQQERRLAVPAYVNIRRRTCIDASEITGGNSGLMPSARIGLHLRPCCHGDQQVQRCMDYDSSHSNSLQ